MSHYCTYGDYLLEYNEKTDSFLISCEKVIVKEAHLDGLFSDNELIFDISEYTEKNFSYSVEESKNVLTVELKSKKEGAPVIYIAFIVDNSGVVFRPYNFDWYTLRVSGIVENGDKNHIFAINDEIQTEDLRSGIGPASSIIDDGIYNKKTDTAVFIKYCRDLRLKYDFGCGKYRFTINTYNRGYAEEIKFFKKQSLLANKFGIDFAPVKKRFNTTLPRTGWMTWYSLGFDTCEEKVLKNVEFQEKHLKKFGANTIWVDWEWCHKQFESRRDDGVNFFNPDPIKYPNGLKFISDRIKEAGFVPALWIAPQNDLSITEYTKENPDIILIEKESWCGTYFYDYSNPKFLNEYLPKVAAKVKEWGFEIIKWDTLTISLSNHDLYHENMYNPRITSKEAFRKAVKKMRKLLGEDVYMFACACLCDANILYIADLFDGSRVGRDVIQWQEFKEFCVGRVRKYYPLHNVVLHTDPDNLVLREEFNNFEQAVSRASYVSLLGLPVTMGDDLPSLPENRIDLIKRILPILDIHPMSFEKNYDDLDIQIINLSICLPFDEYTVADVLNMTENEKVKLIDFEKDLHLENGEYLIYDYFRKEFLGTYKGDIRIDLKPFESRVISIHKRLDHPQIISTSRHITQGAAELKIIEWKKGVLRFSSELIAGDSYSVVLHHGKNYEVKSTNVGEIKKEDEISIISLLPDESKIYEFEVNFKKK